MRDTWRNGNNLGVAILRVSSQRQKDGISHDTQEKEIREYCLRNNIKLVDVFRIIESAKDSDDRKKFRAAIDSAIAKDHRHVLFYMYDRETRNLSDNERNEKLVKSDLIVIHYVRENKVLFKDSPDSEFFIRDVQAAANKQFIRNLSAKVGDAMLLKAEEGWYPGNHPPLGYAHARRKDEDGKEIRRGTTIGVDPNETSLRIVRREFELRSQGYSLRDIRTQILKEGLVPERKIPSYHIATLDKRLKNPFYWGQFTWQGVVYDGKHPLIIPKTILERVKAVNEGKRLFMPGTGYGIFSGGFLKCICGCNIVYDPKKKVAKTGEVRIFSYYHCTNGKKAHLSLVGMNVPEQTIWKQFDQAVDSISITPLLARQIAEEMNQSHRVLAEKAKEKIKETYRLIEALDLKEERVYDDFTKEILDIEGYRKIINRLRQDRDIYRNELERLQNQSRTYFRETAQSTLELASSAKSLYLSRSPEEKREFLEKLLSNPTLDGQSLRYDLRKPFGVLAKMALTSEWRTLVDDFRTELADLEVPRCAPTEAPAFYQ